MRKKSIDSFKVFNKSRFTKQIIYKNRDITVFILNFIPGQTMPPHYHNGAELNVHILKGNGIFTIDGNDLEVLEDEIIHFDGNEKIGFSNTSKEDVSIYVTLSKVSTESAKSIEALESR